jgi:hypothetical protein
MEKNTISKTKKRKNAAAIQIELDLKQQKISIID